MRIIDADAYAIEMKKRQDACRKWKSEQNEGSEMYARAEQALVTFFEAWATLEKQPTIDAIPVEWREEHDSEGNEDGRRYLTVVEALSMWQKEQEAQNETC